ncbi:MAG TPA: HD domain-containing protein, partial [Nitrospirota bacterium]|nr:HD domain-containing protein [Nitrospirota bacterium]
GFLEDGPFMDAFKEAPAAKGMHHVFKGGLLQHTLKVARLCGLIYDEYRDNDPLVSSLVDRDLLMAGAILHDIGKVEELSSAPGFDYTFKGRLLGHVTLGLMAIKARLDKTEGIPEETADLLMHMIISHHGEYEFGSPKRPKCMEAFILHYADNLDAKLQGLAELTDKDTAEGKFTAYNRMYERYFYKGRGSGEGEGQPDTGGV